MNETGVLMEYEQILLGNTINSRSKFTATYIRTQMIVMPCIYSGMYLKKF